MKKILQFAQSKFPHVLLKVFWGIYIDNVFRKQCFTANDTMGQN